MGGRSVVRHLLAQARAGGAYTGEMEGDGKGVKVSKESEEGCVGEKVDSGVRLGVAEEHLDVGTIVEETPQLVRGYPGCGGVRLEEVVARWREGRFGETIGGAGAAEDAMEVEELTRQVVREYMMRVAPHLAQEWRGEGGGLAQVAKWREGGDTGERRKGGGGLLLVPGHKEAAT